MTITPTARASRWLDRFVVGLCALAVLGWLVLARWYALADYYATPGFALDKIPFYSLRMQLTILLLLLLCAAYAAIYWLLTRTANISTTGKLAIVLLVAGAGGANVLLYPIGAVDLFSYLAQLKLPFFYHQNPYVVTFLPAYAADPLAKLAAFLEWPVIYGPAWIVLAGWPLALVGFGNLLRMLIVMKLWSWLFLLISGWCIAYMQETARDRWLAAYLFLANPLVLFEAVGNAHNDVIMTALVLAAVVALRRRPALALTLVLLAALTKAFAIVLLPIVVLALIRQRMQSVQLLRSVLLAAVVALVLVGPFWEAGAMLSGVLRGLQAQQQGIATISLLSLAQEYARLRQAAPQLINAIRIGCAGLFLAAMLVITAKARELTLALAWLLLLAYLLVSSFLPWYLIPVMALLALKSNRLGRAYLFVATPLALLSYPISIWARFSSGMSLFQMRLLVAALVTLPIVVLLALTARVHTRPM